MINIEPSKCPLCGFNESEQVLYYEKYPFYIKPVPAEYRGTVPLLPLKILLCNKCSFVYQKLTFHPDELSKIYELNYESYHSPVISGIGSSLAQDFLKFLEDGMDLKNKKILEIGCFDGYFLSLLRDKHSCAVIGCDPSPGGEIAGKIGITVIKKYFSPALFDKTFDIVILRGVLEHITNPSNFLESVKEVLSEEGVIAVEVPNLDYSLTNGVIGDFFHEHVSYFTKESLVRCLELAGLETMQIDNSEYYLRAVFRRAKIPLSKSKKRSFEKEATRLKQLFKQYEENVERLKKELNDLLQSSSGDGIYVWGGGGHTIGLLSKMHGLLKPVGIIDGDRSKEGKFIPGFDLPVYSKIILADLDLKKSAIIVSSKIFQNEIIAELKPYVRKGLKVIKLYPKVEYVKN